MPQITRNAPQNSTKTRKPGRPVNPSKAKPVGRIDVPQKERVSAPRPKPQRGVSYPWA